MLKKTIFIFAAVLILATELKACPECSSSFVGSSLVNCIKPFIPKLNLKNLMLSKILQNIRCRRNPLLGGLGGLGGLRYPYGGCQSSCLPYSRSIGYENSALLTSPGVLAPTLTTSPYASYLGASCDACATRGLCGDGCCSGLGAGLGDCCGNGLLGGGCASSGGACAGCGGACTGCGGACTGCGGACTGCGGACTGLGGPYVGCGGACAECGGACGGCGGGCAGCRGNCDDLCCGKRGSLFSGKMRTNCFEGGFSIGGC